MTNPFLWAKAPEEEQALWSELAAQEGRRAQIQRASTAEVAQAIGDFHNRAPYADPGVALAVGQGAAQGVIDPAAAAQAVDQAVAKGHRPLWGDPLGMRTQLAAANRQATLDAIRAQASTKQDRLIRKADGSIDEKATAEAAGVPVHGEGGGGAFDWANPTDYLNSAKDVGFSALKGTVRTGLSVAQSSWEEVQNRGAQAAHHLGDIASAVSEGDLMGAGKAYLDAQAMVVPFSASSLATSPGALPEAVQSLKATNTGAALIQQHELGSVDLGSGWFPSGTVTHTWQPEFARDVRGSLPGYWTTDPTTGQRTYQQGDTWTFGRQIAHVVTQPGSKQYGILSGLVDGAAQFAFDPSLAVQDVATASRGARIFQAAEGAREADQGAQGLWDLVTAPTAREAMQATMGSAEGRSIIADLKNAQSPEAARAVVGADVRPETLAKLAQTDDWVKLRGLLQAEAKANPQWAEEFTKIGGDAAQHLATTVTPDEVRGAAQNVLIDAERKTVNPLNADVFLDHSSTQPFLQHLANTTDPLEVMARLGPDAPPSLISAVTHGSTIDEMKAALRREMGFSLRSPSDLPGMTFGYDMKRQILSHVPGFDDTGHLATRATTVVPGRQLEGFKWNATPLQQRKSLNTMNDWMKTFGVEFDKRSEVMARMVDAFASGSRQGKFGALTNWADAVQEGLVSGGMAEDAAKGAMNLWRDRNMTLWGVDALGREADSGFMATHSGIMDIGSMASPSLLSQEMEGLITLPDPRELRRLTSKYGRLVSQVEYDKVNGVQRASQLKFGLSTIQSLGEDIFPKLAVMRAATAVRIFMDEQMRLAANGLPNVLTHPAQWMALVMGSSADLERLGVEGGEVQKMLDQVSGSVFKMDSPDRTLRYMRSTGAYQAVEKGPQWLQGAEDTARQFARDPIASRVAAGSTTDEIVDYLHSAEGRQAFENYKELGRDAKARDPQTGKLMAAPVNLDDEEVLRGWIDQNIRGQVDALTRGNSELRQAIGTNRLPGAPEVLSERDPETGHLIGAAFEEGGATPEFRKMLRGWMEHPDSPERVKFNPAVFQDAAKTTKMDQFNHAANWVFGKLFDFPIKTLTRSPVFREEFYRRVGELADQLDPTEANRLLKSIEDTAGANGFSGKIGEFLGGNKQLDKVIEQAKNANGTLNLDDVFGYAKGHALDTVHQVLFDTAKRTNVEQTLRMVAPFAMAWREILTSWGQTLMKNPGFLRRVQMGVEGARGAGFFYTDPTTGREVFAYPGSDWLVKTLTGGMVGGALSHVPVVGQYLGAAGAGLVGDPLRGDVQGLNLVSGSILPGLGPVVQYPLAEILKNRPEADFARGLLMPYGTPSGEDTPIGGDLAAYFGPSWAKKIISAITTDPDSASTFGNTYAQVVNQLASSGHYGVSLPDRQRMLDDAKNKARVLTVLRGFGQFVLPASPAYAPEVATKQGDVLMTALSKDAAAMQAADYDHWVQNFISTYGEGPFAAVQSKTRSQQGGLDASTEFGNWERDHQHAMSTYKDVAAYFGDIGSDFDFEVYNRQVQSGQRKKLSGDEIRNASESTLARWKYAQARQSLGEHPTSEQLDWLRKVKDLLIQQYPGFGIEPSTQVADLSTKLNQLQDAVKDPSLEGDVQTAAATYLALRDKALASAKARGRSSIGGERDADLRAWLAGAGQAIINKYPAFARLFDGVLSSEVDQ